MLYILRVLLLFLFMSLPMQGYANEFPSIQRLENGLQVLVIEDKRFPIVSSRLYVKAGSAMENYEVALAKNSEKTKNVFGISHLLEHMVFKGSKSHPGGIDKIVEDKGGDLNAYTSYDQTVYYNEMPSAEWELSLEAIQGLAFDPLLREKDLQQEREVVLAELKQRADSPSTQLLHLTTKSSLQGTDYEHPVIGTEDSLKNIQVADIKDYIKKFYDPSEMLLVIVGDVDKNLVFKKANSLFSGYKNQNIRPISMPYSKDFIKDLGQGININVNKGKWNKSYVNISFPIPHGNSIDSTVMQLLGILLSFDDNSPLLREFRFQEQLVDEIAAYAYGFDRIGLFNIYAKLDSVNLEAYFEKMTKFLQNLQASNFSAIELEQAKTAIENSLWNKNITVQSKASFYGNTYFENPADPLGENSFKIIENMSFEQIQEAIEEYIRPESLGLAILLPEEDNLNLESIKSNYNATWKSDERKNNDKNTTLSSEILEINNKTLILTPDLTIPFMSVSVDFLGGESLFTLPEYNLDKYQTTAVPSLTANVLTMAVREMDFETFTAFLSQRDISISASSHALNFQVSAHGATKFSADIFKVISDVIYEPGFYNSDLKKAKEEQLVKILSIKDSVPASLGNNLYKFLFPNHPYGNDKVGTEEDVNAIAKRDLRHFWKLQREQAMVISVAGDYDRAEVIEFVKSLPSSDNSIKNNQLSIGEPTWNDEKNLYVKVEGRNQDYMGIIFPTVDRNHQDAPALNVLSTALSGFNGILFQELREKRNLGYSASPIPFAGEKAGFLGFGIMASPTHRQTITEQFNAITNTLRKHGISDTELERAKNSLQMSHINNNQTAQSRASQASIAVLFGHDFDFSKQYLDKIMKVTKDDVNRVIQKYLVLENAYQVRAGAE